MINFKSIPFFKILLPYVFGVCLVYFFGTFKAQHLCFLLSSIVVAITFFIQKFSKPNHYPKKLAFIIAANICLVFSAFESAYWFDDRNNKEHYSHYTTQSKQRFIAQINDIPVENKNSTKLSVSIKQIEDNDQWHSVNGKTIIYVKNDSLHHSMFQLGDEVFFDAQFSYPNEPQNPFEFDYKTYLQRKNIFHVVFAKKNETVVLNNVASKFNFNTIGTSIKANTVRILRESGLSKEAFSICAALLVGYDDEIDKGILQSFSHSGTLHILSVSGMHTGVLYGILIYFFSLFDKHDRYKKLKCALVIACLIVFVFITGLSPSVLRAALMLALVLIGKTFYRQGNAYNTLLLSAFILLLMNPFLLLDVGFLLSYLAVFGIMYLYPILNNLYFIENKVLRWAWSLTLMSLSATIFTLPITLYYFHQFPIWFVFSNLVIIPLSTGLMIAAAVLLFTYKIAFIKITLVYLIDITNNIMLWFAQLTDNPQYGFIDNIVFSKTDLWFCFIVIALVLMVVYGRQHKYVMALGFTTIVWLVNSIYVYYEDAQQKELVVFSVKRKSAYLLKSGNRLYTNFSELEEEEFQRHVKPFVVTNPDYKLLETQAQYLNASFSKIVHLSKENISIPKANYIIVSHNTKFKVNDLLDKNTVVIADCSNSTNFVKKLKQQCAQWKVPFYSVRDEGALRLSLN